MSEIEDNLKGLKVAVVGDYDSIVGFNALGMEIFAVEDPIQASVRLDKLAENQYAIIFITEPLAAKIPGKIEEYRIKSLPAIVPIPSIRGNLGLGMTELKESVRKAVGIDILQMND